MFNFPPCCLHPDLLFYFCLPDLSLTPSNERVGVRFSICAEPLRQRPQQKAPGIFLYISLYDIYTVCIYIYNADGWGSVRVKDLAIAFL